MFFASGYYDGSDIGFKGLKLPGSIASTLQLFMSLVTFSVYIPKLLIDYTISVIELLFATLTYHVRYWSSKSFQGEKFIILGADSSFGRTFSEIIVKMNGTVICVDSSKESLDSHIKKLNTGYENIRAFFYQCDVHDETEVVQVLDKINNEQHELAVVINCAEKNSLVSTYFGVYNHVLKLMQNNKKGKLVFIRTLDKGPRDAIMGLYSGVREELDQHPNKYVSTVLVHVYPNIAKDEADRNGIFGYIKPDEVARTILEGIAKNRSVIYMPGFMNYLAIYLKFLPESISQSIEGLLFEDKKKAISRRDQKSLSVL